MMILVFSYRSFQKVANFRLNTSCLTSISCLSEFIISSALLRSTSILASECCRARVASSLPLRKQSSLSSISCTLWLSMAALSLLAQRDITYVYRSKMISLQDGLIWAYSPSMSCETCCPSSILSMLVRQKRLSCAARSNSLCLLTIIPPILLKTSPIFRPTLTSPAIRSTSPTLFAIRLSLNSSSIASQFPCMVMANMQELLQDRQVIHDRVEVNRLGDH